MRGDLEIKRGLKCMLRNSNLFFVINYEGDDILYTEMISDSGIAAHLRPLHVVTR